MWVCLAPSDEARSPLSPCTGIEGTTDHVVRGRPVDWHCSASRNLDNFIDLAHFSIIHTSSFGNPDVLEVEPPVVERGDDGALATVWDYPVADAFRHDGEGRAEERVTRFRYRIDPPFTVTVFTENGFLPMTTFHAVSPITARTCRSFWAIAFDPPEGEDVPDDLVEAGQQLVYAEDRAIVEHQRPYHLPLDRTDEVHCAFDRPGLAYREVLRELGFPDGATEAAGPARRRSASSINGSR